METSKHIMPLFSSVSTAELNVLQTFCANQRFSIFILEDEELQESEIDNRPCVSQSRG
jgi:hypothetical protein